MAKVPQLPVTDTLFCNREQLGEEGLLGIQLATQESAHDSGE